MGIIQTIAEILLIIGGLNWALTAFGFNVVEMILGTGIIATIIYVLVGISAIIEIIALVGGKK